jgi:hypothetical protein
VVKESGGIAFMAIGTSAPRLKLGLKDWLYDSGADHHITHDRSLFTTFEALSGTIAAVGAPAEVKGKGTVSVTFDTEFGPRKVLITDCLYIPSSPYNLFSAGKAINKGFRQRWAPNDSKVHLVWTDGKVYT